MKKFVKITTRTKDGDILRSWIEQDKIVQLSQNIKQQGDNEGSLKSSDGKVIQIITFNETLDSLN
jgi:hypothetical protein